MWLSPYFSNPLLQDLVATGFAFALMLLWLRFMDGLAERRLIHQRLSRKLIHIGTGPLFLLCWNLYSPAAHARWLAALVPAAITLQFAAVGLGLMEDPAAVQAMSRTGDRREILHGPLYYGIIFVVATVLFWRHSPVGILALMILCGGDGLADVFGRRWGRRKLPWAGDKSWIGSLAMLLGSFSFAWVMVLAFSAWGYYSLPGLTSTSLSVLIVALVATLVESLPLEHIDNVTVFLAGLGASWLLIVLGLWPVSFFA
jgi:phytol kinase